MHINMHAQNYRPLKIFIMPSDCLPLFQTESPWLCRELPISEPPHQGRRQASILTCCVDQSILLDQGSYFGIVTGFHGHSHSWSNVCEMEICSEPLSRRKKDEKWKEQSGQFIHEPSNIVSKYHSSVYFFYHKSLGFYLSKINSVITHKIGTS